MVEKNKQKKIGFSDYLRFHKQYFGVLLIQLTLTCPLECRHCIVRSGPARKERLDVDDVQQAITSFSKLPEARLVCLTGGEPFSHRSALRSALTLCSDLDLYSYVITSANWATDQERAVECLRSIGVIDLLSVSADHFHSEYISTDCIFNALRAADALGISSNVLLTHDKTRNDYKEKIIFELERRELSVDIAENSLGSVGRAYDLGIGEAIDEPEFVDEPCPLLGCTAITATGNISACCQVNETNIIEKSKRHSLYVGEIKLVDYDHIKATMENSLLMKSIRLFGPNWVYKYAVRHGIIPKIAPDPRTMCGACARFTREEHVAAEIEKHLSNGPGRALIEAAEFINGNP